MPENHGFMACQSAPVGTIVGPMLLRVKLLLLFSLVMQPS